jgi:hypothetical protein
MAWQATFCQSGILTGSAALAHLIACCGDGLPRSITQVAIVSAIAPDHHTQAAIPAGRAAKGILPAVDGDQRTVKTFVPATESNLSTAPN